MNPGIQLNINRISFTAFPKSEIGAARYCKSFELHLEDIQLISISPRLVIDDEALFILIIDKTGEINPLPQYVIDTDGLDALEKHFHLSSIKAEWEKFSYEEHQGGIDKIIYPKAYYWKDLFENNWKLKTRVLYSWFSPKAFFGTIDERFIK